MDDNVHVDKNEKNGPPIADVDDDSVEIYTKQKGLMDYASLRNIQTRIGEDKKDLMIFVIKELLDNAVDYIESNVRNFTTEPSLSVYIDDNTIKISNTSILDKPPFTREKLDSIFTFDSTYSTKKNLYKISRGNIGDALKEVLCIPYALARDDLDIEWNEPLVIDSGKISYYIRPNFDRVGQEAETFIEEHENKIEDVTSITIRYHPEMIYNKKATIYNFIFNYTMLNTHITFNVDIFLDDPIAKMQGTIPHIQRINPNWRNPPSIKFYSLREFQDYIKYLEDKNMKAYSVIRRFREGTNLKMDKLPMTVGELQKDDQKISELYDLLWSTITSLPTVETPFEVTGQSRKLALKERLENFGLEISNIKYKYLHGYASEGSGNTEQQEQEQEQYQISIPFIFEMAIINANTKRKLTVINGINSSARIYSPFISKYSDGFTWQPSGSENLKFEHSLDNLFKEYGYTNDPRKSTKPSSIILVNLIAPKIEYQSYGKGRINERPFANEIAELAYKMCYGGGNKAYVTFEGKKVTGIGEVRTLLLQRNKDIIANPELKETDRWTQATVFYRTRKILKDKGSRELKRASIISYIDDICRDELKKPREQLGIYAADRAQMYFKGRTFDVGFDEIQELLEKGTDLVIIEKEGAAQNLIPFANRYGCAILNTRGFLTDYAKMLSTEFFDKVKNMVIVTDFDVAGILIAKKLPKITRIGIDFDTIEHFGLNAEDVQEDYKPNEDHLKHLEEFGNIDEDLLDYLEKTRIEIDSITAQVGNQRFWNFIMDKLEKIFTTRDYTRAIDIPDYIAPKGIKEITDALAKKGSQITENLRDEITKEMENVEGFKDTQQTQIEINDRIASKILEDSDIKSFIIDLENIKTKYDWLNY